VVDKMVDGEMKIEMMVGDEGRGEM